MALVVTTNHLPQTSAAPTTSTTVNLNLNLGAAPEGGKKKKKKKTTTGAAQKNMSNSPADTGEKRKKRPNRKSRKTSSTSASNSASASASASASTSATALPPTDTPADEDSSSSITPEPSTTTMAPAARRRNPQGRNELRAEENARRGATTTINRDSDQDHIIATPISTSHGHPTPSIHEPTTIFNQTFYPHSPDSLPEPLAHGLLTWSLNMRAAGPNPRQEFRQWNMRTLQYWKAATDKERFMGDGGKGWEAPRVTGGVAGGRGGNGGGGGGGVEGGRVLSPAEARVRARRQRSYTSPGFLLVGGRVAGSGSGGEGSGEAVEEEEDSRV